MDFFFSTSENRGDLLSNIDNSSQLDIESSSFFSNDIISYHSNLNLCNSSLSLPIHNNNINSNNIINNNNMVINDNVPLFVDEQQQQQIPQDSQNDYNQVQQQIQNQLFQYNQLLQTPQQQQQQQQQQWNTSHQQLFSSDYSSPETNHSLSPNNELPQSPYNNSNNGFNTSNIVPHTTLQFPDIPTMSMSSPETIVHMPTSPSNSVSSSGDERIDITPSCSSNITTDKPKKYKKRKLFDPSEFRGADLSDVLLEISSEDFKEYKKNFFTGTKVSKSDQNLINSQYRKIKNRESAQRSREKKNKHTEEVEDELEKVRAEMDEIRQENKKLKLENENLRKQQDSLSDNLSNLNGFNNFPSSSQYQQFSNMFSNVLSPIGSSSSSIVNTKKVFCIFIFAIALCFYMAATPNFNNQYGYQPASSSSSQQQQQFGINSFTPYTDQISNSHINNAGSGNLQFGNGGRSVLETASYSFDSLSNHPQQSSQQPQPKQFDPQSLKQSTEQPKQESLQNDQQKLLNREHIKPWSASDDNVKATFSFNPNNGLKLYKSLPKSIRDRISHRHKDQEMYDINDKITTNTDDEDLEVDSNNNIVFRNYVNNIPLLDNDDNPNNNGNINDINLRSSKSTTTTTTTTADSPRVNNSTMELTVQNNFQIIDDLLNQDSNSTTRLPASSYNFKFLIDGNTFLGSNEVAKALAESHNQHLEFISILVQINKNPPNM